MVSLITVKNASRRIGRRRILRVEDLEIRQGEHWCFFGPNGSGKSLLANLLAKRHSDFAGSVTYSDGFEPSRDVHVVSFEEQQRLWARDNRLDMSEYADDAKDLGTTVLDLVKGSRPPKYEDSALLNKLMEQLLLADYVRSGIRFLSSGQIRRALIARALYAFQPSAQQLLILDDPLESIDIDAQPRVRDTISEFLREGFSSIQLCRRYGDILPVATHLAVMESLQTGELTQPELNQLSQLATTVLRNPAIYPQVRQFVINQGLASAQDIPEQFDEGLIFSIIVAARAANTATNGQNMMTGGSPQAAVNLQQPLPSMAQGGVVNGREDKPVDIRAHEGEYVVPKRVVEMKGREFFDKLLAQYKDDPDNG